MSLRYYKRVLRKRKSSGGSEQTVSSRTTESDLANEHGGFVTVPQPRKNQSHRKVYGNVHGQQEPFVYNKRQLPDIAGEGECGR